VTTQLASQHGPLHLADLAALSWYQIADATATTTATATAAAFAAVSAAAAARRRCRRRPCLDVSVARETLPRV